MTSYFVLLHLFLFGAIQSGIPRDTSFTITSTAEKITKQYPNAHLVLPSHTPDVLVLENIVYSSYADRKLHLDIFRPKVTSLKPAVILIHGGGWRSGERTQNNAIAERLAERGLIAVSVEYRLSVEALYPAAVYDLKAAVRWLRAHAVEYGIDSTRMAAMGCSAGGHLAALLGTTNKNPMFEGGGGCASNSSAVEAVVDIDGILDFTDPAESGKDTIPGKPSAGSYWFGGPMREKRSLWVEASPLVHVDRNTAPIEFINSAQQRFHAGRDTMIQKLNALGIYHEVHTIPDTPHPFWFFSPWFERTCEYSVKFLEKVFQIGAQ